MHAISRSSPRCTQVYVRLSIRDPMKSVSTGNSSLAAVAGGRLARLSKFVRADRVTRDGTVIGNWRGGLARVPFKTSACHFPASVRLSATHALAAVRPPGHVNALRIGAAAVTRRTAWPDKAEGALRAAPRAFLTRIERRHLRVPSRLAVAVCQ